MKIVGQNIRANLRSAGTLFPHWAFFQMTHWVSQMSMHRKNFTTSDDALILEQPVSRIGIEKLATMLRTSPGRVMRRADELGVSLVPRYHDEAVDTRAHRCTDGLVDPLLQRLKQVHGDRK
jgi:hypothetical protein